MTKARAIPMQTNDLPPEKAPGGGHEGNAALVKAYIIEPTMKRDNEAVAATKELPPDDLFAQLTSDGRILVPPFDKLVLAMIPENSTSLGPVISAMTQNVDGFGQHFECRLRLDDPKVPEDLKKKALEERARLINFFSTCCPEYSYTELRKRTRTDIESTGEGYTEVIRVPATGEIIQLNHIPSYQMNLGPQDPDLVIYKRAVQVIAPDGSVTIEQRTARRRFRKFVQSRLTSVWTHGATFHRGAEIRWFKEFGDPRVINNRTGDVVTDPELVKTLPESHRAGELIHWKIYSPRTPYGLPRYIGNLITLFGDRASDEINYTTLRNNNVPSIMLTVANGQLTEGSIERIQQYINSQIAGQNNYSKILIVEAEGAFEGEEQGIPKIGVEKMTSEQNKDQLFQAYSKNNRDKVRECWRIPPIFLGRSEDYTRSTAEASRRIADEQVFSPEREEYDTTINNTLLAEMGIIYHKFVSNGPNVTDDQDLINVMGVAEKSGGMTPKLARQLVADILGMDEHALPPLDPSIQPDVPFMIQIAESVKNTAEPQHQMAVKSAMAEIVGKESIGLGDIMKLHEMLETVAIGKRRAVVGEDE